MAASKKIKMLLLETGMSQKELAERLGMSQQSFSNRLTRDDWKESDLEKIAKACGYTYESTFKKK